MDTRILRFAPEFAALRSGRFVYPQMVTVFPVYGCNFSCTGCHYNLDNEAGFRWLDVDRFLARIDEMQAVGLRAVSVSGGGEPLLHRRIRELFEGLYARGLSVGLITNATRLLVRRDLRDLVLLHHTYVRVSIWPETEVSRTNGLTREPRTATLGCRCLVSSTTAGFYLETVKRLAEGAWDYIDIKAERQSPNDPVLQPESWAADVVDQLKRIDPRVRGSLRKTSTHVQCYLTPIHTLIDADGTFLVCCFFQDRKDEFTIARLDDPRPFTELWTSGRHSHARASIEVESCNRWDCRFFPYLTVSEAVLAGATPAEASVLTTRHQFDDDEEFI